ncbi:hypothetical protein [Roseateles sp.]|uniref:hypothetical protein n=1 Tax=Roseateles sp. TaxID=1971397 RepID=UPI00286C0D86|nr:hypothetical protein [Roseateles sp.]
MSGKWAGAQAPESLQMAARLEQWRPPALVVGAALHATMTLLRRRTAAGKT